MSALQNISKIEDSLWEAADQLRANSKLTSSEYCMPVLGVIFLRHATNRYQAALQAIQADQAAGKMPKRPLVKGDFIKRRALMLPAIARYDHLLKLPSGANLGAALVEAMNAIEADFEPLANQLPKDYDRFDNKLLEDLLRNFDFVVANPPFNWLYRGQRERFLGLVDEYLGRLGSEASEVAPALTRFETQLTACRESLVSAFIDNAIGLGTLRSEKQKVFADAMAEWAEAANAYLIDRTALVDGLTAYLKKFAVSPAPTLKHQHAARQAFDPLAAAERGLVKQIDLLYKLAARAAQLATDLSPSPLAGEGRGEGAQLPAPFDRRATSKLIKQLDAERKAAVEQLKAATYLHRQIAWLQDRFPKAEMQDVPGLCKVVSRAEIEVADWSLTSGRYVGVAPAEVDEDFDFEQTLRDIHAELADLNCDAVELAARIQENFEELGV
ncbi:MAG: type I restriction-modification system subunit M N-terminal domain-containing protein [Sulfuritalea sp.]|nr:type I restriction-modification system subunit M N-terminal domain-containing protein [Sulfuritalea sp.]